MAVIGRLVALLEANTADFQARMTAAERVVHRFDSANTTATRGLRLVRSGIDQLASSAIGIHGPLGLVAGGLTQLGGTAALGAVAVLGEIVLISRAAAKVLDEVAAAAQRGHDAFASMAGSGVPLVAAMEKVLDLQTRVSKLQEAPGFLDRMLGNPLMPFSDMATARATGRATEATGVGLAAGVAEQRRREERELLATNRALSDFKNWLDEFTVKVPGGIGGTSSPMDWSSQRPDFSGAPAAYEAARRAAQLKLDADNRQKEMLELVTGLEERGATVTQQRASAVHAINTLELQGTITARQAAQAMRGLEQSIGAAGRQAQMTAAMMVTAFAQVIASIAGGGSFGSIVTGIGGVLSFVNPLAGAIVGGLGGIIMAVENRSEKHNEDLNAKLVDAVKNPEPQGTATITIYGDPYLDMSNPAVRDRLALALNDLRGFRQLEINWKPA